jgi:type I restriction enzyme S subunit
MSSESSWQLMTLQDAGISLIDCDHKTPTAQTAGFPYIAIPQLKDGHVRVNGTERRISETDFIQWTKKLLPQENDVIVVRRCNSGQSAYVPKGVKWAIGQNLVVLRSDGKKVFPPFLRWLVRSDEWWEQVRKYLNVGAVFDSLKCREIPLFELPIPPMVAQIEIATVLNSIDARIELLRETNATLEAIAQALFKSWFVDFDPVHANAGTQTPSLPQEIQALFPATFTDSPQGSIPDGWELGHMQDLFVLQRGFDLPASVRVEGAYPLIAASGPNGTHAEAMVKGPGVVTGRSGVLGKVFFTLDDFWPLNTTLWIKEFKRATPCYAFEVLRRLDTQSFNAGSAVPSLNRNHIHGLPYILPPQALVERYEGIALTTQKKIHENNKQADSLIAIRDTLLPRLISGQLRLPEAKQAIAAITD